MVAHASDLSIPEAAAEADPLYQPALHSKFQDSKGYRETLTQEN